jgi:histidinol-phosphate aminotransferase
MSRYWSDIVSKLEPYVPGEQPKDKKYIKLNTNENPYPPSPKVLEAIKNACNSDIRLYPDPECDILRKTIAEYFNLEKEQVFVGNGSDELLAFSFMAFFNPGKPIFFPDITYSFYPVYSQIFNIDYKLVELDEEFSVPVDKFLEKNGGIILPNPNAPTGKFLPIESIKIILSGNPDSVVIIDEAYIDFGGESASRLINEFPNLLVIQTLSKSRSLAGLRLGFALGNKKLTEGLDRVKNSFNSYTIDRLALAGAEAAFKDEAYFQETRKKIIATRDKVSLYLKSIGFKVIDSKANFIFISPPSVKASTLFQKLRENGVLVRYFNKARIEDYLRVSIGSEEDMDVFIDVVKRLM